jgi:hypothetical protein
VIGRLLLAAGLPPGAVPAIAEFVIVAELAAPAGASALRYLRAETTALRADARRPALAWRRTGPGQVTADAGGRAALLLAPDIADLAIAAVSYICAAAPGGLAPGGSVPGGPAVDGAPGGPAPAVYCPASGGGHYTAEVRVTSVRDPVFLAALDLPDTGLRAAGLGPVAAGPAGVGPGGADPGEADPAGANPAGANPAGAGQPPGYRLSARIPCGAARGVGSAVVTCTVLPPGEPGPAGESRPAPHPAIARGLAVDAGLWDWLCDEAAAALTPDTPQSRRHAGHLAVPRSATER